jgi:hypothetical protein
MATDPRTIINDNEDAALNPSGVVPVSAPNTNATLQTVTVQYTTPPYYGVQDLQIINDPGGNTDGAIQFNASNRFGGDGNLRWDNKNKTLNVSGNIRLTGELQGRIYTSTAKFKLYGGVANYVLSTDGNGNLSWVDVADSTYGNSNVAAYLANYTGNVNASNINVSDTAYLYNISSTGTATITNLVIHSTGTANLGPLSNIKISGGSNGQFLSTDGNGNLSWVNISNANYATYSGTANVANSVSVANVTGIGNIATTNYDGNASNVLHGDGTWSPTPTSVANANYANTANIANVSYSIDGANVNGTVANANYAIYSGTANTANSVAVGNVTGIGNIATLNLDGNASNILYGNGVFAAAPSGGGYGNSNVASFLASFGSNTITTTGNVSVGNITATNLGNISSINKDGNASNILYGNGVFAAPTTPAAAGSNTQVTFNDANVSNGSSSFTYNKTTGTLTVLGVANTGISAGDFGVVSTELPNTVVSFTANVNSYTQVTLQNKNTGADATADYILTADNGTDTVNYLDLGIINSGYDANTPTNSLGNIVYAADSYLYAQGNVSNTSQPGGNLAIGTTVAGKSVKIFAGGTSNSNIVANISNTGVAVTGNLTTTINVIATGNVSGSTLISTNASGDEGGELQLAKAPNSTLSGNIIVDSYINRVRVFDGGGTNRGMYFDIANSPAGVGAAVGYRDIPQVTFSGNATLAATDAGKHYYSQLSTANTLTIPNNASVSFSTGATINIINQGTGNITIAQGTGVSLYLAGNSTSANRTLTSYGIASITKVSTDTWFISGVGLL